MRALVLNCTLKPSPAPSNSEALARVLLDALEAEGVETDVVRVVDHDVKPGVESDNTGNEDGAHHVISELSGALVDIGYTIPGQAWTYWHLGPGQGPDYLDEEQGHEWAHDTGKQAAHNLLAVARALQAKPIPPSE